MRGVLARVKHLLDDGVEPADVYLIVRDENLYGPLILAVAREYGIQVAAYYAVPLKNTRVGSFVKAFITLLEEGYPYEATTRFLGHPLTDSLDSEAWASIRQAHPQTLSDWGKLGLTLPTLPAYASRADFVQVLSDIWEAFELRLPREVTARSLLAETLGQLEPTFELPREQFLAELDDILHTLTVAVKPGSGVSVHTPLAVLGAKLPHVFVLGLNEGVFPPDLRDDAALDFLERKHLRAAGVPIETAPYAVWREQLSFHSLLRGVQDSLTLSSSEQLGGALSHPSYYFDLLGLSPVEVRETQTVSEQEQRAAKLLTERGLGTHGFEVEQARESVGVFNEFDGVTGVPVDVSEHIFSATQLTHLLSCPFKWFAAYVLKAEPPQEFEEDALLKGNLYHTTLELLAQKTRDAPDVRDAMLAVLDATFIEAEAVVNIPDLPAWSAKRLELLAVLRDAIRAPGFIGQDAAVLATEQQFTSSWQGFKVRGRIDRLDKTPDGLVITDYKSGSYISQPDVQLNIYETAASELHPGEAVSARYYSLKEAKPLKDRTPDDLSERLETAKKALATGVFPPIASKDNCEYCAYTSVCRKGPRLAKKKLHADA